MADKPSVVLHGRRTWISSRRRVHPIQARRSSPLACFPPAPTFQWRSTTVHAFTRCHTWCRAMYHIASRGMASGFHMVMAWHHLVRPIAFPWHHTYAITHSVTDPLFEYAVHPGTYYSICQHCRLDVPALIPSLTVSHHISTIMVSQ